MGGREPITTLDILLDVPAFLLVPPPPDRRDARSCGERERERARAARVRSLPDAATAADRDGLVGCRCEMKIKNQNNAGTVLTVMGKHKVSIWKYSYKHTLDGDRRARCSRVRSERSA